MVRSPSSAERVGLALLLTACSAMPDVDAPLPDARADDAQSIDASPDMHDDARDAETLDLDAAPCCVSSHYAGFPIPSSAGSGLPTEARYVRTGELVSDAITGRVWQLRTDGVRRSLEEALAYCDALSLEGRSDFHLPTRIELITLLEVERSPTIAADLLPTEPEYHWTSSRWAGRSASAFSVYFGAGAIDLGRGENRSALARCVAGEGEGVGPQREGDLAFDASTGLRFRPASAARTYAEAQAECASVGMAIPTVRELASILDDARTAPAIDVAVLGGPAGPTWTANASTASGERWIVDLDDGRSRPLAESATAAVRCVLR